MGAGQVSHSKVWWLLLGAALLTPAPGAAQSEVSPTPPGDGAATGVVPSASPGTEAGTAPGADPGPRTGSGARPAAVSVPAAGAGGSGGVGVGAGGAGAGACPTPDAAAKRGCERSKRQLICNEAFDRKFSSGSHKARGLTLCAWPGPGFDPAAALSRFPQLERFTLTASNVSRLLSDFPPLPNLQALELSGLRLEELSASALAQLPALRVLDLRANALRSLPAAALAAPPALRAARLADNPWDCSARDMDWVVAEEAVAAARVADAEALMCGDSAYSRRPLLTVLRFRQVMEAECPREANCSCSLSVVPDLHARGPGGARVFRPMVTVDCSGRGLRQLPPELPGNATTLHVEHNQITDLRPLVTNEHYREVLDLYLDGNEVRSVAALEGSAWLLHFRLLSLRGNRLERLPTYALESALQRNRHAAHLYLGDNPWTCDCQSTPSFQEFLAKYRQVVQDQQDIRCAPEEGASGGSSGRGGAEEGEGEGGRVLLRDVSRNDLCREHAGYLVQPLDLLNGALASLILLILGKLAYDYWHFKRTGKLPWIVTKMP